jgi:hypothetical protein
MAAEERVCRTVILHADFYGYETWSLTSKEEHTLMMY